MQRNTMLVSKIRSNPFFNVLEKCIQQRLVIIAGKYEKKVNTYVKLEKNWKIPTYLLLLVEF